MNREKLSELADYVQWAANAWVAECLNKGLDYEVREVYRTQSRQNYLWSLGRTVAGTICTWTLLSNHTKRLACDIYIIKGIHKEIAAIGEKYGITHPFPTQDPPHYEFTHVHPPLPEYSPEAQESRLVRGIARATVRGLLSVRDSLVRTLARLRSRL